VDRVALADLSSFRAVLDPWEAFQRVAVSALSTKGAPYVRHIPWGMPDLNRYRDLLDCVFFLYPTREHAEAGTEFGGTGFFVGVPLESHPNNFFMYAVSNWHVVKRGGSCVLRVNKKDDTHDIIETGPEEWTHIPNGHDVAVRMLNLDPNIYKYQLLLESMFPDAADANNIGVGEDVFMIGRFVDYSGTATNEPALRFGHISIMQAPILQPTGARRPSVVIDMHSRSGFSGSPVFAYRTTGSQFLNAHPTNMALTELPTGHMMKCLGIHWGQFPEEWELKRKKKIEVAASVSDTALIVEGEYIHGLSGMSCVVPGAAIMEIIKLPKLEQERKAFEVLYSAQLAAPLKAEAPR
jgi:hypothetical protein